MFINSILLPWQLRYFNAFKTHRHLISCVSRQCGKSFIASWCCVYDCIINGATWTLVSTGQRAADELLNKCLMIAKYFQGMLKGTKLTFAFQHNATTIRFSNGAKINSLPNNPDGLRGFSSSLLMDEMAFIANADECWQACIPFLTSPHGAEKKLQIISTPGACSGKFYELWEKSDYYHTKVTLLDAVNEGLKVDVDDIRKTVLDDDIFRQEYMCEFLDSNTALFSYELLRASISSNRPTTGKTYIGIDIGRTHDKTSICILKEKDNIFYVDHIESLRNKEFEEQFKYISQVIDSNHPIKVCVDATGIGAQLSEQLHKKHPCVVEVKFTNEVKNEMFNMVKKHLGTSSLKLPPDELIIEDLHKIKRVVNQSGNISYRASRDENGHADDATSIALAVYATKKQAVVFNPIAVM